MRKISSWYDRRHAESAEHTIPAVAILSVEIKTVGEKRRNKNCKLLSDAFCDILNANVTRSKAEVLSFFNSLALKKIL